MIEKILGLRQRIQNAANETEINQLLSDGAAFEHASARTQRSWKTAAARRRAELNRNAGTAKIQTRLVDGN